MRSEAESSIKREIFRIHSKTILRQEEMQMSIL